jgi:hypothetical protein
MYASETRWDPDVKDDGYAGSGPYPAPLIRDSYWHESLGQDIGSDHFQCGNDSQGAIIRSSSYARTGLKSGMRSIGLNA